METEYQKRNCLLLDEREIGLVGETDVLKGTFSIENEGACIFGFDLIFAWYFSSGMIPLDKRRASFSLAF